MKFELTPKEVLVGLAIFRTALNNIPAHVPNYPALQSLVNKFEEKFNAGKSPFKSTPKPKPNLRLVE